MGKIIGSIVVGYITLFVLVFILFSIAWMVLGADGALRPGVWDVSFAWLASSIVVGLVAAVVGGWVCAAIAKDVRGPNGLAIVVVVLGLALALPVLFGNAEAATAARPDTVGMFEAMQNAKQPVWDCVAQPAVGCGWCPGRGQAERQLVIIG